MASWIQNWRERHQHPASFWLHMIGIPMAVAGLILGAVQLYQWRWDLWWRPTGLIVLGYLLQWIGHVIEGNEVGEIILIKKILGMPYVAVSPKYASQPASGDEASGH
jgi:hypothetical protein